MKALMIEVVNKVFTFLTHMEDLVVLRDSARWNRQSMTAACWNSPAGVRRNTSANRRATIERRIPRTSGPGPRQPVHPVRAGPFLGSVQPPPVTWQHWRRFPPTRWRRPGRLAESVREVSLIGEAAFQCDLGEWQPAVHQQILALAIRLPRNQARGLPTVLVNARTKWVATTGTAQRVR
jgi:hypothetical protein